jgi:hypothetical protein
MTTASTTTPSQAAGAPREPTVRPVIPHMRWLLWPFTGLAVGATAALYFGSTHTDDAFAWTIAPPLTAALLGSAYAGAVTLFSLALRERIWANVRIAFFPPLVLSTFTLIATLLHLDKFHLDADPLPAAVAWIWLVVYLVVPPAMVALLVAQLRVPGSDPPRSMMMPAWIRTGLAVYCVAAVVGGLVLFLFPSDVAPHWPWAITPLTGRALAAWIVGLGVAAGIAFAERDLRRVRIGFLAFGVIGAAGLIAVARYADDLRGGIGAWLLVAVLGMMAVLSAGAAITERRQRSRTTD